jgi:phosphoribosyl-ATP pyrophosphohydrolase
MADILDQLAALIEDRKRNPKPGSYTNTLLADGSDRIAQKVGEEAVEVIIAALSQSRDRQVAELADLYFHTLVLMGHLDISLDEVRAELTHRHQPE